MGEEGAEIKIQLHDREGSLLTLSMRPGCSTLTHSESRAMTMPGGFAHVTWI